MAGLPGAIHSALHYPGDHARFTSGGFCFPVRLTEQARCAARKTNPAAYAAGLLLPDLDSNQDKLNQNQLYYHYTIGQPFILLERSAKVRASVLFPK